MTTLFVGAEDCDFVPVTTSATIDATAGHFRAGYARCALAVKNVNPAGWAAYNVFNSSSFWFSARIYPQDTIGSVTGFDLLRFKDASNIDRIRIRNTAGVSPWYTYTWIVEKLNSVGVNTQLGSAFTIPITGNTVGKIDVNIVYSASGSINIYASGIPTPVFTYSGDTTTDGVTALAGLHLLTGVNNGSLLPTYWSEIIVDTLPTLTMALVTSTPVANGNTHNWTVAGASNVNQTAVNLASADYSTTAGQIDQYTVSALPAGTFSVRAVAVAAFAQKGTSGPTKIDMCVRTGGTDYFSPDISMSPLNAPIPTQYIWTTNPNTTLTWQQSEVGTAPGFNIGVKSVT